MIVNGEFVPPVDPMFEREGKNRVGAKPYGPPLHFEIAVPDHPRMTSSVQIRFTELPVLKWHSLSKNENNLSGISRRAGVSIIRGSREIDRGWYFMGEKRRENYDDWWRCEITFTPVLDELFGVTHTKQGIYPGEYLSRILTAEVEAVARDLSGRARKAFLSIGGKVPSPKRPSERLATQFDHLIEPPARSTKIKVVRAPAAERVAGLVYVLERKKLDSLAFFTCALHHAQLTVTLNERHPFVRLAYSTSVDDTTDSMISRRNFELLLLAAARAEVLLAQDEITMTWARKFRDTWSNILAAFLS